MTPEKWQRVPPHKLNARVPGALERVIDLEAAFLASRIFSHLARSFVEPGMRVGISHDVLDAQSLRVIQRFGLDAYQLLRVQERLRQCSTNPLMVMSFILAAVRIRSASSEEHLRSIVVLGPGGRTGVLGRLRFSA